MSKKGSRNASKPFTPVSPVSQISDADRKLFTKKELEDLENEAALSAQEDMREEARARVLDRLKAQKRSDMQRALDPEEERYLITLDLAPFADRIMLDGTIYLHGATYEVSKRQYDTMREIVSRTWKHEHEIGNANSEFYRKPRNVQLGPKDTATPVSQLMRV